MNRFETVKQVMKEHGVVNSIFVFANIAIFIFLELIGNTNNAEFMASHGAMFAPYVQYYKEYYRLFTCMFLHFGISHLINNMLILFCLGDNLERCLGKIKYAICYVVSGLSGNIISFLVACTTKDYAVSAGASGAIFGVIGGLLYCVIVNKGKLEDMTTRKLVVLLGLSLYFGFTSSGVDNLAHVGGLIGGIFSTMLLYRRPKRVMVDL